jgi:hypothetical protein
MDDIVYELSNVFNNAKKSDKITRIHLGDKSGKSKFTGINFVLESGYAVVICYDYYLEFGQDHLEVAIDTPELNKWLQYDAFQ